MHINGCICISVSDKWELFDSEWDMTDILPLKVLTINKGCPISAILYNFVAEILALKLKK